MSTLILPDDFETNDRIVKTTLHKVCSMLIKIDTNFDCAKLNDENYLDCLSDEMKSKIIKLEIPTIANQENLSNTKCNKCLRYFPENHFVGKRDKNLITKMCQSCRDIAKKSFEKTKIEKDYAKSCIYKLSCNDNSIPDFYIGSTTDIFTRQRGHKSRCNNPKDEKYNYPVYNYIRENGGFDNWNFQIIQQYNAIDKNDLESQEKYWILRENPKLNTTMPVHDKKQYYQDNKEDIIKKVKIFAENHPGKVAGYKTTYAEKNKDKINEKIKCECGSIVSKKHLAVHKKTKKHIKFIENNQTYISIKPNEKITCKCGSIVSKKGIAKHMRTHIHLSNMQKIAPDTDDKDTDDYPDDDTEIQQ